MRLFNNLRDDALDRARRIISRRYGDLARDFLIEPIPGGASTRKYFRVFLPRVPINATGVLMLVDKKFRLADDDFYQVSEILRKIWLPVPQIYEDFSRDAALYLQDVGDSHLCDLVRDIPDDRIAIEELYRQAIDHVVTMQTRAEKYRDGVRAFTRAFDEEKLLWELDFMMTHFATSFCGWRPEGEAKNTLDRFFRELVRQIAALPRVFCHRDYHSRNLMFWSEKLYILDFQDARMGPHLYDIVSLLGDSYIDLGEPLRFRLLEYYIEKHPDFRASELTRLHEQYSLVGLQRHLKHLGTFGYLHERGDSASLQYVPLTIRYLEEHLGRFTRIGDAAAVLRELFAVADAALKERG